MSTTNPIKIKDLQSVKFFTTYASWASNINVSNSKFVNEALKVSASVLSTFVLIGSIFLFIFNDIPMLTNNSYNYFIKSPSAVAQISKPLFIIGAGFLAYKGYESLMDKVDTVKKTVKQKVLIAAGVTTIIGLGIGAYSMGYLSIK